MLLGRIVEEGRTILASSPLDDSKKPKQTTYLSRPAAPSRKATLDDSHLNGELLRERRGRRGKQQSSQSANAGGVA
jgi:hypothetical protein